MDGARWHPIMNSQSIKIIPRKETLTNNSVPFRLNGGIWWIPDSFCIAEKVSIEEKRKIKRDILLNGIWIQENKIPEVVMMKLQKFKLTE
jgi:hypothetical protein